MGIEDKVEAFTRAFDAGDLVLANAVNKYVPVSSKEGLIKSLYVASSAFISASGIMLGAALPIIVGTGLNLVSYDRYRTKVPRKHADKVIDLTIYSLGWLATIIGVKSMITGVMNGDTNEYKAGCVGLSFGIGAICLATANYLSAGNNQK